MMTRIFYTTKRFIDLYEKIGVQALIPKKRGHKLGTGRLLNPAQEKKIQYNITLFLPESFKLNYSCLFLHGSETLLQNS
jgi:hypothetical protein